MIFNAWLTFAIFRHFMPPLGLAVSPDFPLNQIRAFQRYVGRNQHMTLSWFEIIFSALGANCGANVVELC